MKTTPKELIDRFSDCPSSQTDYEADGKKITVVRHFTGDKDVNKLIFGLAQSRADREAGIL